MDEKINKYKLKKNKIENKINELLKEKQNNNTEYLKNIYDNEIFNIINNCEQTQNILILIVTGIYSSGKTTFINNLEYYYKNFIEIITKINIKNNDDLILLTNFKEKYNNKINEDKINCIIIESELNFINNISELLYDESLIRYIYLIPNNYKKKLINKIFYDMISNTDSFNININKLFDIIGIKNKNFNEILNLFKTNNNILYDNDFNFIDEPNIIYIVEYAKKYDFSNIPLNSNIIKIYF